FGGSDRAREARVHGDAVTPLDGNARGRRLDDEIRSIEDLRELLLDLALLAALPLGLDLGDARDDVERERRGERARAPGELAALRGRAGLGGERRQPREPDAGRGL